MNQARRLRRACDVLFGGCRLTKSTTEVLALYQNIRRRYPDPLRIHLVSDNPSLHWTPLVREWAQLQNVELVPTPASASYLNPTITPGASDYSNPGQELPDTTLAGLECAASEPRRRFRPPYGSQR